MQFPVRRGIMILRFFLHDADVPKWLKGPHSKCGRAAIPSREFKSLHLRQYKMKETTHILYKLDFAWFFLYHSL